MDLVLIDQLPNDVSPLSVPPSDTTMAEGFKDAQGIHYVRMTCIHGNRMVFRITEFGTESGAELDRLIRNAAISCNRCG